MTLPPNRVDIIITRLACGGNWYQWIGPNDGIVTVTGKSIEQIIVEIWRMPWKLICIGSDLSKDEYYFMRREFVEL